MGSYLNEVSTILLQRFTGVLSTRSSPFLWPRHPLLITRPGRTTPAYQTGNTTSGAATTNASSPSSVLSIPTTSFGATPAWATSVGARMAIESAAWDIAGRGKGGRGGRLMLSLPSYLVPKWSAELQYIYRIYTRAYMVYYPFTSLPFRDGEYHSLLHIS